MKTMRELRMSKLYLGSASLLESVEWVADGRGEMLCLACEDGDSVEPAILSVVLVISGQGFWHEKDGYWKASRPGRDFDLAFSEIKYSFEGGEGRSYPFNDREAVLKNALNIQKAIAVEEDDARHVGFVIDHSRDGAKGGAKGKGNPDKPLHEDASTTLRMRHNLFEVSFEL